MTTTTTTTSRSVRRVGGSSLKGPDHLALTQNADCLLLTNISSDVVVDTKGLRIQNEQKPMYTFPVPAMKLNPGKSVRIRVGKNAQRKESDQHVNGKTFLWQEDSFSIGDKAQLIQGASTVLDNQVIECPANYQPN